ncbi:MAG: radical SAM protein [Smithellaceae bacterium]|nr:radical SAM protein [Smithellaceae bacterium]
MRLIVPVFVPYRGCPNRCVFCNENITADAETGPINTDYLREKVKDHVRSMRRGPCDVQLAFYGGNFTGMEEEEQVELLGAVQPLVEEGSVKDIRVSTRPDYIDDGRLELLKRYNVSSVEIGAQSLVDSVLQASGRGHSAADVTNAVSLLKRAAFETGLHLMVGLPGDDEEKLAATIATAVSLRPDSVRIHPTIVFKNSVLADLFGQGKYHPLTCAEAAHLCLGALRRFAVAGIPVIRMGLQETKEMEEPGAIVAGPHHPSFRTLVEEMAFGEMASYLLARQAHGVKTVSFLVNTKDLSSFRGRKNINLRQLQESFPDTKVEISPDDKQPRGSLFLASAEGICKLYDYGADGTMTRCGH